MAQVMLGKQQLLLPVDVGRQGFQLLDEQALLKQLLLEPQRQRLPERRETARRECEVCFQQALEFQEWLVVESDKVDVGGTKPGDLETRANGGAGKVRIVLHAREALFLGGVFDAAVDDERCGGIVVIGGEPENAHERPAFEGRSEQRVDERREGRTLGEDQKSAHDQHQQDDGQQPELLAGAQELPKFTEKGNDRVPSELIR